MLCYWNGGPARDEQDCSLNFSAEIGDQMHVASHAFAPTKSIAIISALYLDRN